MGKKLGNPLVAAVAADATGKAVQTGGQIVQDNFKPIVLTLASVAALYWGPKAYRKWRAKKYANDNIGNPNVTAAAIIYNSFKRFTPPGWLSFILPTIDISTNEQALYEIASKVNSIKSVSDAYRILFQRNLFQDVQNGLDTEEMKRFFSILEGKSGNPEIKRQLLIGSTVYNAKKSGVLAVKKAKYVEGIWKGTGELFGQYQYNDELGEIVARVPYSDKSTFYIIKDNCFFGIGCDYGLVWDLHITDKQL